MISNLDKIFFRKAKSVSAVSDFLRTHIGCVVTYKGKIIGIACNTNKTRPEQKYYNRYRNLDEEQTPAIHKTHAEIMCLAQIKHMDICWNRVRLYIYRERHDISHGLARPCPACMKAIKNSGIQHIYYTTDGGYAYENIN